MKQDKQILYLKISIVLGLILLIVGHYILSYSELPQTMGIQGLILGGACMAFGIIFSLPTKMYLTFLLVKRETDKDLAEKSLAEKRQVDKNNQH